MKFKKGDLVYVKPRELCSEKEIDAPPGYNPTMGEKYGGNKYKVYYADGADGTYQLENTEGYWWSENILERAFSVGDKVTVKSIEQCRNEGLLNEDSAYLKYMESSEVHFIQNVFGSNCYTLSGLIAIYDGKWLEPYEEELAPVNKPSINSGDYVKLKSIAWYNKQDKSERYDGIYIKGTNAFDNPFFISDKMKKYFGRVFKVLSYDSERDYLYLEGIKTWTFNSETVEKVIPKAD